MNLWLKAACPHCGGPCARTGINERGRLRGCQKCAGAARPSYWTPSRVIESLTRWSAIHGRAPYLGEWMRSGEWCDDLGPFRSPSGTTVKTVFPGWDSALDAAGLSRPPRRPSPRESQLSAPILRGTDVETVPLSSSKPEGQFVYFIETVGLPFVKIGHTSVPPLQRLRDLQVGSPLELRFLMLCPGPVEVEDLFHDVFTHLHIRGEWFKNEAELSLFLMPDDDFMRLC